MNKIENLISDNLSKNITLQERTTIVLKKPERIRRNLRNLIINSTIHGLPNSFKAERPLFKIMWLIFFLISASFGLFMVVTNLLDYLDYEIVTKFQVNNESPMVFPTITFYNLNKLKQPYSLDEILISCSFNDAGCSDKDFEVKKDNYQSVYGFNSGRNSTHRPVTLKKQSMANPLNGFRIILFAGLPEESSDQYYRSSGFHVTIHNNTADPGYVEGISYSGIKIPVGFKTFIIIERVFIN